MKRTTAFGAYDHGTLGLLERVGDHLEKPLSCQPRHRFWTIRAKRIILATGALERHFAFADNDSIDTAYGTAVVVQDDAQGAVEELLVSAESGAVTIAGSPGDNELCYFRVGRDISDGNDDMAGDARLTGIQIFYTTDAANDA